MTSTANIVAAFDRQQADRRVTRNRRIRSAQQGAQVAAGLSRGVRVVIAAIAVGLIVALVGGLV